MSVLDRARRKSMATTADGDQKSADPSSADSTRNSPVIERLNLITTGVTEFVGKSKNDKYSRHLWIVQSLITEVLSEMEGTSEETLSAWIAQFGQILTWCGNGDDSLLPENVREYLRKNKPELLAITVGVVD